MLGSYEPVVIRTTVKVSSTPIWSRVRIGAESRVAAQALCSRLRAVGEMFRDRDRTSSSHLAVTVPVH